MKINESLLNVKFLLQLHDKEIIQVPVIWNVEQNGYNQYKAKRLLDLFVEKSGVEVLDSKFKTKSESEKHFKDLVYTGNKNISLYREFIKVYRKAIRKAHKSW